ncbi:MAG TPA: DUF1131 family protein [Thiothrix sp.]|nr:DUF1131 family protein [Thiothrix sp.]
MSVIISVMSVAIVACSNDADQAPSKTHSGNSSGLVLSVAGVGPINRDIPFNLKQINLAFREYDLSVEEFKTFAEGNAYPIIRVSDQADLLMVINPDVSREKIFSVMITDNRVGNVFGHTIGQKFGDIYRYGQTEECAAGAEELAGKVLCYAPTSNNILYLFKGNWDGPSGKVPPNYVLSEWSLDAIIWKPQKKPTVK